MARCKKHGYEALLGRKPAHYGDCPRCRRLWDGRKEKAAKKREAARKKLAAKRLAARRKARPRQKAKRARIRRDKLDRLWSLVVKTRDGWRCRRNAEHKIASPRGLQAAHVVGRSRFATRWDPDNGISLCAACHFFFHGNPALFVEFVREQIGSGKLNEMVERGSKPRRWTKDEKLEIQRSLEGRLKELQEAEDKRVVGFFGGGGTAGDGLRGMPGGGGNGEKA